METIRQLVNYIIDSNVKLSHRAIFLIVLVVTVLFVDNILGFSYFYQNDRKIEELQKLNSIIQNPLTDSSTKVYAISLRVELIHRDSVVNYLYNGAKKIATYSANWQVIKKKSNCPNVLLPKKNNVIFFLSANWFILFVLLLTIIGIISINKEYVKQTLLEKILYSFIVAIFGVGLTYVVTVLCNFIPLLSNTTWTWNYLLNAGIQLLFLVLMYLKSK